MKKVGKDARDDEKDREVCIVDMKVSSEQIRSYVAAQSQIKKQSLPEESRKVILRLPVDSVSISPQAASLQKGRLRVQIDDDGAYTKVTNDNSNPMMQLLEEGMRDVKKTVDKMKELTKVMEDEEVSVEDRYAVQMELADLEGELEKRLYKLNEDYQKLGIKLGLPRMGALWNSQEGQTGVMELLDAGVTIDSRDTYLTDRATGEISSYRKYADMIDKRTALKKEMIQRTYMREHDPEAFEEYAEKLRETYRKEFRALADEDGNIWNWKKSGQSATEQLAAGETLEGTTFPTNKLTDFVPDEVVDVDLLNIAQTRPNDDANGTFYVAPEVDHYEYRMEQYVEEKLARLEESDYAEFNAIRISVMSASLAKESSNFLENLTNQLTAQFQNFAAVNELVGEEDLSQGRDESRMMQIALVALRTLDFLQDTLLGGIQKDATRASDPSPNYKVKIDKAESPMEGVFDIFKAIEMTPAQAWDVYRPDLLFTKGDETE